MEKSYDNLQRTKDEIRISEGSSKTFFSILDFFAPVSTGHWPLYKWRARKPNNRFKAAATSEKNFRAGLLPCETKDVARTIWAENKKLTKSGKLIIFVRFCHNATTNLLLSYQLVEIWRVSVFENRLKEQPVMAKQMVKNIQFDLLEKRKEIDYLGRFRIQWKKSIL